MHNIRHLPDENHRPADTLLQAGKSKSSVANLLRIRADLDPNRLLDNHRDPATRQALQRLTQLMIHNNFYSCNYFLIVIIN